MNCVLCQLSEADVVYATDYWRVVTNHNQNKLGKCMVRLRRHEKDICNLSDEEVHDLGHDQKTQIWACVLFPA